MFVENKQNEQFWCKMSISEVTDDYSGATQNKCGLKEEQFCLISLKATQKNV